jgi:inhibitor of cysteine peptidase
MTIELHEADAGSRSGMEVGERATVRLPESPTTGYRWIADFDSTRLRLVEDRFDGPELPRGGGGERVLVFEALRSGSATLTLGKKRAWESGDPVETFAVELDVQE